MLISFPVIIVTQLCSEDVLPLETWIRGAFDGYAFGFCTREPQVAGTTSGPVASLYVFESCIAESNTTLTTNPNPGCGFDIFNLIDSKIINNFAEGNNIGINVTSFPAPASAPFVSTNNIFRGNVVSANTHFGIQDVSGGLNAYYSNQAQNNGTAPATMNYSGALVFPPAPTPLCGSTPCGTGAGLAPVLFWALPGAPCTLNTNCVPSTPLDNISIVS